jgi:hypothetical protein
MKVMGKHSTPLDGVTLANGHALAPFTIPAPLQVTPRGPAATWPQAVDDDAPGHLQRWREAVTSHRGWLAAVPIILVNSVAFCGQLAFLRGHLPWILPGQVLVAATLESVAVYLAWQAHLALAADDSALRLRLAAYSFAAVIGVMNYSHYMAPHWRPTFAAVTFGLMSLSSPWLWSVHSRRASRDALKAAGLIEAHAVRLGMNRWMWHPVRSWRVMFRATWEGETDPARAIALIAPQVGDLDRFQVAPETTPAADPEVTAEQAVQVTPGPPSGADLEPAPAAVPSQPPRRPGAAAKAGRKSAPRSGKPAAPARISDADLLGQIRGVLADKPDANITDVAKELGRGRDRIRPLLEQARAAAPEGQDPRP